MSKIRKLLTLLLNVKPGFGQFLRLLIKVTVAILTLGAVIYGLYYIPMKSYELDVIKFNLNEASVYRTCLATAKTQTDTFLANLPEKQRQQIGINDYYTSVATATYNCLFLSGRNPDLYKNAVEAQLKAEYEAQLKAMQEAAKAQQENVKNTNTENNKKMEKKDN